MFFPRPSLAKTILIWRPARGLGEKDYDIWAAARQNQQNDVRPAKTQISLGIRPVWSESSLCAQWVAEDPCFIMRTAQALIRLGGLGHFLVWNNYLFELFLKCRGTMKLILSTMFYLCLSLFSNCINISNLNSDSLFVNNHEYKQLSIINICLLHCARIRCNLPRNNPS